MSVETQNLPHPKPETLNPMTFLKGALKKTNDLAPPWVAAQTELVFVVVSIPTTRLLGALLFPARESTLNASAVVTVEVLVKLLLTRRIG